MPTTTRSNRIRTLLLSGKNAADVADTLDLSRRYVFDFANRNNLPTNPTIHPGGRRESQILKALAVGYSKQHVLDLYSIVESRLDEILTRTRLQIAKVPTHS